MRVSRSRFGLLTVLLAVLGCSAVALSTPPPSQDAVTGQGLTGRVLSGSGVEGVAGATVQLVPVSAIDTHTQMTASAIYAAPYPAEAYDEPLEDAIRARGSEFPQATTDAGGNFVIVDVPEGTFFVHVTPAAEDLTHLPGGSESRSSRAAEQLRGHSLTISLSTRPSDAATTVGSSTCLGCHSDHEGWGKTAHKLGWSVPQAPGPLQDFSAHPEYFRPLASFTQTDTYTSGTHLELGDYDANRGDDKFKLRVAGDERMPIAMVYADVYLWRSAADQKYYISMVNRLNPQDPNSPAHLEIKLVYGGVVHDQRYIVSVPEGLGSRQGWYTLLRYNMSGRDERLNRSRRVWHDYKFWYWWASGTDSQYGTADDVLAAPPVNTNAVQTMCASCHLNGWERYQDPATSQYLVRAVDDPAGDMNIDDDPAMDEINVGCENCHGAGSEHVANPEGSRAIVSPRNLSSERASVVCGRCHDRRQGFGGPTVGYTQAISMSGELARPGISRHELLTVYTDPVKKGPTMPGPGRENNIWPDDVHSTQPHQQYSDFLKSGMYRNERLLVTCSDCHDMHGTTSNPRWLLHDAEDPNSALCQRCHTVDLLPHMQEKAGATMKGEMTRCIDCHMPGTLNTGGIAGDYGRMIHTPPYTTEREEEANTYWESPMNSHVFDVPRKTNVGVDGVPPGRAMPIPYTAACGTCHVVDELPYR
ncbi:MAG: cytochrome c3 family protein [Longimicrobiales bacterium]